MHQGNNVMPMDPQQGPLCWDLGRCNVDCEVGGLHGAELDVAGAADGELEAGEAGGDFKTDVEGDWGGLGTSTADMLERYLGEEKYVDMIQ